MADFGKRGILVAVGNIISSLIGSLSLGTLSLGNGLNGNNYK